MAYQFGTNWARICRHGRREPAMYKGLTTRPLAWAALALAVVGLAAVGRGFRQWRALMAFVGSSLFLAGLLAGLLAATAALMFPVMLRSSADAGLSLTAYNSAVPVSGLRTALSWWIVAAPLAVAYLIALFRIHRGPVPAAGASDRDHGHTDTPSNA